MSSQTTVLIAISELGFGGAERQVINLANGIGRYGVNLHVASMSNHVPAADLLADPEKLHVLDKAGRFDVRLPWKLKRVADDIEADVLHGFLFDAEITARLTGLMRPRLVVLGSERNANYRLHPLRRLIQKTTLPACRAIVANSQAGARYHRCLYGTDRNRYHVIHNGVDLDRFVPLDRDSCRASLGLTSDQFVIGMFASFKAQKNHAQLLRALERVRQQAPDLELVVLLVGDTAFGSDDSYRETVLEEIRQRDLTSTIRLLGNRSDLPQLYAACDVSVLPSYHEGTPNVVLEAMACGVPVIVNNISDNALIVEHGETGYLVEVDDDEALAVCLLRLARDPGERLAVAERGQKRIRSEFSVDRMCARFAQFYRELGTAAATDH